MKFEKIPDNGCGKGFPSVTTLDAASATRVVAIDLQVFNVGRQVQGDADGDGATAAMANDDAESNLQPKHVSGRLVELQPLTKEDMLESFRALRESRRDRHEDDMVIEAIVDDERPTSLTAAIKRA